MSTISMDPRLRARRAAVRRLEGRRRLRYLTMALGVVTLAVLCWYALTSTPLFDVDEIRIEGVQRTPVDQVLDAAAIQRGEPLVELDIGAAMNAVTALPWVDEVRGGRSLSGVVTLEVTERVAVAAVRGATGWLLVDADGRVLEAVVDLEPGLMVVDGPRWNVGPGGWVGEGALASVELAASLPPVLAGKVASVRSGDDGLELVLFGGGVVAIGSADDLDEKFAATLAVLTQAELRCLDTLDVRAAEVPVLTRVDDCS